MDLDIPKLLTDHAGPIVASLSAIAGAIVGGLIARGTVRSTSRKERTDEYRREVRSAASSVVGAVRTFLDAASAFEKSMFWATDVVSIAPEHDESYQACKTARAELEEKLADFEFLVDVEVLIRTARKLHVDSTMTYYAMYTVSLSSHWRNYSETDLDEEKKQIRIYMKNLEDGTLPRFRESVSKYMPHTIVEEKRRRERIPRAVTASWRSLIKQCRKIRLPSPPW